MKKFKKLIIACDGESASGKSTAAKLISKKYNLLLVNSGLLYRYGSKLVIKHKPKNVISFLNNKFKNASYKSISKQNLHSEIISNHVALLAKNKKVREIVNKFQKKLLKVITKFVLKAEILQVKFWLKIQSMIWHFILNAILKLLVIEGG